MEEEKKRLADKIKELEKACSPPWWLAVVLAIGELLAKMGIQTMTNTKFFKNLKNARDMQNLAGMATSVAVDITATAARQLFTKYVDGKSEQEFVDVAFDFLGLPKSASEGEVDLKYKLLEAEFAEPAEFRKPGLDPKKFEELKLAYAKIKDGFSRERVLL